MSLQEFRWLTDLNELVAEYQRWRKHRWSRLGIAILVLTAIYWFAFGVLHVKHIGAQVPIWLLFGGGAAARAIKASRQKIADHLQSANDPRCTGALASFAVGRQRLWRETAIRRLRHVLPLVRPEHYDVIAGETETNLASLLSYDLKLNLGILNALECGGGRRALPVLERIAASLPPQTGEANDTPDEALFRAALPRCLRAVRERVELDNAREQLLRAASPDPDLLLRPEITPSHVEVLQLLRPVE